MKGILNLKNFTNSLPVKRTINFVFNGKNIIKDTYNIGTNKINLLQIIIKNCFSSLNEEKINKKKKFEQEATRSNFFNSLNINLRKNLLEKYYKKIYSNLLNTDYILQLSGDKNNLNSEHKNINEKEMDIKLNTGKKNEEEEKNSNGDNDDKNKNNNNNSPNYIKFTLIGIGFYIFFNYISELKKENNKIMITTEEFMDKIGNNSIKKIGLVYNDDISNNVNIYAVDKNDHTYKIKEKYDKETFLRKIEENSKNSMKDKTISPSIVYEYTNDIKNKNLLFAGILFLAFVIEKIFRQNHISKHFKNLVKKENLSQKFEKLQVDMGVRKNKFVEKISKTKFSDVAGLQNPKIEVMEFVDFLKSGEKYVELGARIPRGALFTGPPGTGKTLLAKAIAGEADVNFYSASGSEFQKMYVGEGAAEIRKLFEKARENAPSIIFIDEIDSIGKKRDTSRSQLRDDDGVLNQLLVEMDGFSTDKNVIVFAATNRSDLLDSALLRSGRFDRNIEFTNPNESEREEILMLYIKKVRLDNTKTIEEYSKRLAKLTSNFSGADLANLVNEAAIISARENKEYVDSNSFEKAFDRVYYGLERKRPNTKIELSHISLYESAKVVCSWFLENVKPIIRVSILPKTKIKAKSLSLNEDKVLYTKEELLDRIVLCLSGRVAEEHYLGTTSTLSAEDLSYATRLADKMLKNLGMGKLGNITSKNMGEKNMKIRLSDTLLKKECLDYNGIKDILGPRPDYEEEEKQKIEPSI